MIDFSKNIIWLSKEIKTPPFSEECRIETGFLLRRIQDGEILEMPYCKFMPSVGNNCYELRINDKDKKWRIIYYLDNEFIVILSIFNKKTNKTPKKIIKLSKERLKFFKNI